MTGRIIFFLTCIFVAMSCSRYPGEVERALRLAGDHRMELEKVLEYYSREKEDALKYRAACFLIANMPGKYSGINRPVEVYEPLFNEWKNIENIDFIGGKAEKFDSLMTKYRLKFKQGVFQDIHHIPAGYLIDNIERAFEVWTCQPWGKDVDFDAFCEDILPYRISSEPLENWRGKILEQYRPLYESLKNSDYDAVTACTKVLESMDERWYKDFEYSLPELSYSMIENFRTGSCKEMSVLGLFVMRALGIPVAQEYTPQWPFRSMGHDWNAVRDKDGTYIPFLFRDFKPGEPNKPGYKMAKAFRKTYAYDTHSLLYGAPTEYIPPELRNLCRIDVSAKVFPCADVQLSLISPSSKNPWFYLSVFDNRGWVPIHWGKQEKTVTFSSMGKDIVYLPVYYQENELHHCSSPFLLTPQGEVHGLKADTTQKQTLKLLRKHPLLNLTNRMVGGKFQAANRPDFSDTVTLHAITENHELHFQDVIPDHPGKYRYYRYLTKSGACNIAELEFYENERGDIPVTGRMIGTSGSYGDDPMRTLDKAFDGNPLTFFQSKSARNTWVGMDFGKKTEIRKIRYLPRTDDNTIVPGQTYELFYFAPEGWRSLGKQIATGYVLYYDHAPVNALFWLRNLTKGVEERIFTYEDDRQVWR